MTRVPPPLTGAQREGSAGLIAAIAIAAVLFIAVAAIFAFALLRPATDPLAINSDAAPSAASPTPTGTPTPTPPAMLTPPATPTPTPTPTPSAPTSPAAQACDGASTILSFWAHPDDDIIFANPTISDAIAAGQCVRTVFVTAGDAGKGMGYVQARELGILRAYNAMRGQEGLWHADDITLASGLHLRRLSPDGDARISVVYVRLPDGNITDGGFAATGFATLSKLFDGSITSLAPVDGGPAVTREQLVASLRELAGAVTPSSTLTHIPRGSAFAPGDHPDHSVVGALVREALWPDAAVAPGIRYFLGYPSENLPRNLDGAVLDRKVDTYRIYTQQDKVIRCADRANCLKTRKFGEWLQRSYPKTEAELQLG
ncbi:GlcNAc-PI de-N-acetylase [Microbacterium sp. ru370.1]|uniref:PIG-L family deacetylase n=2 Tax=unclassified Microbacterium TaxID=2609290 RepID=UPI0008842FE6|nr:PIG-L family deacetylase [Microbacterium sp. RU1D]SDO47206.1 GlcNAc-PI de-N-acetylase [Microbacterium sp. ru370.1]SIT82027.1 GlcNAc-PI de-N-acetylase [Microbacterium sp. RU1D]